MAGNRGWVLLGLAVAASLALAAVLLVVWEAIFWAVVLALLFLPLADRLTRAVGGRRNLGSGLAVSVIVIFVLVPALFLVAAIAQEASALLARVQSGESGLAGLSQRLETVVLPRLGDWAGRMGLGDLGARLEGAVTALGEVMLGLLVGAGQNAASFVLTLFLMLYLLFFLFRDGRAIGLAVFAAVPLAAEHKQRLFDKLADVSKATLKGTLVVGLVQGALGGVAFAALGIGAPLFWGAVMTVLSVLPVLGTALVWVPAAAIMMLQGHWTEGLVLLGFGALVISSSDNILRPIVVGHETRMPDYLVLFTTVGGLGLFGISGLVLGPVLAGLALVAWQLVAETRADSPGEPAAADPPRDGPEIRG